MTDIIKSYTESKSEKITSSNLRHNFEIFRKELEILQANKPIIITFGNDAYKLLKKHLKPNEFSELIKVTHYAYYGDGCATYEGYRRKVLKELGYQNS